jgi:cytoskeletal protein CcmA (bactofilin family)
MMNVFGRRREERPDAPNAELQPDPRQEAFSVTVPTSRDPDPGATFLRPTRDASTMSLAPKPPTPTMPTPPAGTAIPPRPPQMGGQMGGPMGGPMGNPMSSPQGPMPSAPTMPTPRPTAPDRRTLVVGRGISLQGTVADAERLVVEGTVESQMIQATELSISQTGVFKGEVQVEDAEIAGTFDGTLTARGQLVIRGTGRVIGVARCRRLMVEDGGQISGKMEMLGDAQIVPGPAPRAFAEG